LPRVDPRYLHDFLNEG
jgi:hypothetical protein